MRKAVMWVLAVTLLAASCVYSAGLDRSSTSGPVIHNRTTGDLKQVLERAAEFPLALHFTLYGPPDPAMALRRFNGGAAEPGDALRVPVWQMYMMSLWANNPSLKQPLPTLLITDALNAVPCDQQSLAGKDLGRPFVCPKLADEPGLPSSNYVLVMSSTFKQKLLDVAAKLDAESAWRVVSMAVALLYAQYMRQAYGPLIGWPDRSAMDNCVAGMSLRAIFPRLTFPAQVDHMLVELDKVAGVVADITHDLRRIAFTRGYLTGSLVSCAEPY